MKGKILLKQNYAPCLFSSCFIFSPSFASSTVYPHPISQNDSLLIYKAISTHCLLDSQQTGSWDILFWSAHLNMNCYRYCFHSCAQHINTHSWLDTYTYDMLVIRSQGSIQEENTNINFSISSSFKLWHKLWHRYYTQNIHWP